ncbi:pickpocket protein 19-like [Lucilia cuprina]|uniref:pickpocket protein 19-like n=1 Tax=Lucilia cuprina TaxID=7375 RepID=UPI001F064272|nr:pickpocket protein 19-like [Lucilia cuprina]
MYCRGILNFIIRCQIAIYQGWIEYCQRGCLIGSQYLVKPNYHSCERRLWQGIFIVCISFGCFLLLYYATNYSENVFRIVIEDHGRDEEFDYPALGICQMGIQNDEETLARVEDILNNTIYKSFPSLRVNGMIKDFMNVMTFQNLNIEKISIRNFFIYMKTLPRDIRDFLQNFNYKELSEKISSNCEELFGECRWLDNEYFKCCELFRNVSTMLGKCFIFNSELNRNPKATKMINEIEIFREPFRMHVTLKKASRIFLLNSRDVPEIITPLPRYRLIKKGVTLSMEFNIVPIVNDKGLQYLKPRNVHCIMNKDFKMNDETYLHHSYSTCVTNVFYDEQIKRCNCTDLYAPDSKAKLCTLSQYVCLENHDLINSNLILSRQSTPCFPNCFDSEYIVENMFYRDVPEIITPLPRYRLIKKGVTLSMEFNIVPIVNDKGLQYLKPRNVHCIMNKDFKMNDETYLHHSYSTCVTNVFYDEQIKRCNCTDLYAPDSKAKLCTLSQYVCLENHD